MKLFPTVLACALLAVFAARYAYAKVKKSFEFVEMRNCSDPEQYRNHMTDVKIFRHPTESNFIRTNFIVNEPGSDQMKVLGLFYRCPKNDTYKCSYFMRLDFPNGCKFFTDVGMFWTPLFNSSRPEFRCNFPKATYRFSRMMGDVEEIVKIASNVPLVSDFYWVGRAIVSSRNKPWACWEYVFAIMNVKV